MTAVYHAMQAVGAVLCVGSFVWASRTRHQRRVWRHSGHSATTAAVVLELEEQVRRMDRQSTSIGTR
jgi:uncharacterized membrane protein YecN with MAPEG domain